LSAEAPKHPLRPDSSPEDYVTFYRLVGESQLEEAYYAKHSYALARHHLLSGLLRRHARKGEHLVDIGCASGYYSVRYVAAGGTALGVDIAQSSVDLAAARARRAGVEERCRFVTGDVRDLPVESASCDVVLATEVLEHVREQRESLAEMARVLRPGGTLVVSSPGAFDSLGTRDRMRLRNARDPEEGAVTVERLSQNEGIESFGIPHDSYFHDAFTFRGLQALVPPTLEIESLRSLWFVPPRTVTWFHLILDAISRRTGGRLHAPYDATPPAAGAPIEIPGPHGEVRAMMDWTRAMWRVPRVNQGGIGVLLVARRRG
jgi:SAM-dependent methyltransferase